MKKTIFISSTYKDLVKERKAVWELLKRYDVNIVGMEEFGARKDSPLTTCLKEVEQSNIYIGIIANRWGSIEEESGKSYTQLEYEKAIEKDKEILIYLIDETASVQIDNIDFGEKHESLELFKKELQKNHTIDRFINATDLVEKLERKIDSLIGQYKYPSNSAEFKDKMEESKKEEGEVELVTPEIIAQMPLKSFLSVIPGEAIEQMIVELNSLCAEEGK